MAHFNFFLSARPHQRVDPDGAEELLADPGGLLADGVHVELGDLPGEGLVLHVLVLVHDVLPPLGVVDEGGDVGHDGDGLLQVVLVPVVVLGALQNNNKKHRSKNIYLNKIIFSLTFINSLSMRGYLSIL